MSQPAPADLADAPDVAFDAFYREARGRLLVQAFALTGDLPASRRAVRDTFVVAWHHWSKIGRQSDPEAWARTHAWSHALRRHTARPWHREKGLEAANKATIDALRSLPVDQRRVLILNHLTTLTLPELAHEAALRQVEAETALQTATAQFSTARECASTEIQLVLENLHSSCAEVRWPRHTIIRRAGSARRRTHTAVGAVAAVACLVAGGMAVNDPDGAHPVLARETFSSHDRSPSPSPTPESLDVPATALVDTADLAAAKLGTKRAWLVVGTDDNTSGDGLVVPCQGARYADARGASALVRRFESGAWQAFQVVEASASARAARRAFDTTRAWYAGCSEPRLQLTATYRLDGLGDQGDLFVLRDWAKRGSVVSVAVTRTGQVVTTTATRMPAAAATTAAGKAPISAQVALAGDAVGALCDLPYAGGCTVTTKPAATAVDPLPVPPDPAMVGTFDLPALSRVTMPWQASEPVAADQNTAATRCDQARFTGNFRGVAFRRNQTRTFLVPGAGLPDEFGLTQTVGVLTPGRAKAFVELVRSKLTGCSAKDLGTDVSRIGRVQRGHLDLTAWRVTTEISNSRSVHYAMAILRDGARVSQLGFIAAPRADISDADFVALAKRALERLHELPTSK